MIKFEVGNTYSTRSACDTDCAIKAKVISRTEKFITIIEGGNENKFKVFIHEGIEKIKPWGNYSMCPVLSADRVA